jgi:hypothetical protein
VTAGIRRIVGAKIGAKRVVKLGRYAIGACVAIAVLAGCSKHAATAATAVARWPAPEPCVNRNFNLSNIKVSSPTPAIVAEIAQSYRSEPARELRSALNAYVAGTANAETVQTLPPYGKALAKGRFILATINRNLWGGWTIRFQFRRHMDTLYETWLYIEADSVPTLHYMLVVPCTRKQIRGLNRLLSAIDALPYGG